MMRKKTKILAGIALAISLFGWLVDLHEFEGNYAFAAFEVSVLSFFLFTILFTGVMLINALKSLINKLTT